MGGKEARRWVPIHAYVGPNGGGKSLAAVHDSLASLDEGRRVLSTVRLVDPSTGQAHRNYERLHDREQLLAAENCDILLDEVTGVASSRGSQKMPPEVANLLVQLRRRDVVLRWTAPSWKRADVIIRECTQAVTLCTGYLPKRDPDSERRWAPRRLFVWKTYDAMAFDEFSLGKTERLRTLARQMYWRPGGVVQRCYDTYDAVDTINFVDEVGTCLDCGGSRPRPRCTCATSERDSDPASAAARKGRQARARTQASVPASLPAAQLHAS